MSRDGAVSECAELLELRRAYDREQTLDRAFTLFAARPEHNLSPSNNAPFHSARVGDTGEIHCAWHPLFGQRVPIVYAEHRRNERVAICELPDGSRAVVPVWMLDRVSCATLSVGAPRCSGRCPLRSSVSP
jgi:hypothetical protein